LITGTLGIINSE